MRISPVLLAMSINFITSLAWSLLPQEWTDLISIVVSKHLRRLTGGSAPFHCYEYSTKIPDTYEVTLADHHTLEEHKQAINRAGDLQNAILEVDQWNDRLLGKLISNDAKTRDKTL